MLPLKKSVCIEKVFTTRAWPVHFISPLLLSSALLAMQEKKTPHENPDIEYVEYVKAVDSEEIIVSSPWWNASSHFVFKGLCDFYAFLFLVVSDMFGIIFPLSFMILINEKK